MATVLKTTTTLTVIINDFTLLSEYSGVQNPNVLYDVTFNVSDALGDIEGALVVINEIEYLTDINGQVVIPLIRGDYVATVSATGHVTQEVSYTVIDQNLVENVVLEIIGSYDNSYDNSYENITE